MKIILSLVLLINLLGYLMMTNVPPSAPLASKDYDRAGTEDAGSLVLLSELSDEQLADLSLPLLRPPEDGLVEVNSAQDVEMTLCEVLGPFANDQLAAAALALLLPDLASQKELILASPIAQFWLSIPAPETLGIPADSWRQLETKKRYREDCMEVANRLKFH
jgi:hypothetical protein